MKIKILFKNGCVQEFTCDDVKVVKYNNTITKILWENPNPIPLYFDENTVESILQLKED